MNALGNYERLELTLLLSNSYICQVALTEPEKLQTCLAYFRKCQDILKDVNTCIEKI